MNLSDKEGLPWTATTGIAWIVFFIAFTSGLALVALALYLALWVWSKGRSVLPLLGFATTVATSSVAAALDFWHKLPAASDWLGMIATTIWIIATFLLRSEIREHYWRSEGWDIRIGPWFTLFFSAAYINYCLNPVGLPAKHPTVISLNLSSPPDSAKIDL